jgi:ribosome biogenesis GTPase A
MLEKLESSPTPGIYLRFQKDDSKCLKYTVNKTLLKSLQYHCQMVFSRFLVTTLGNTTLGNCGCLRRPVSSLQGTVAPNRAKK